MTRMKLKKTIKILNSDKIIAIIFIIFITTFLKIKIFTVKSKSILLNFANNQSTKIATSIINISLKETFKSDTNEILNMQYDGNGNFLGISIDNQKANKLNYQIIDNILLNIKILESGKLNNLNLEYLNQNNLIYKVPIGIVYNIPAFVDISAKIPFKISFLSNVESNINTKIKEYGINNSLIEIYLKIILNIQVILPFSANKIKVTKEIPIDSRIVQGKIPQYYGGVIASNHQN